MVDQSSRPQSGDATSGSANGSGKLSGNSLAASLALDLGGKSGFGDQQWNNGISAGMNFPAFPFATGNGEGTSAIGSLPSSGDTVWILVAVAVVGTLYFITHRGG